MTTLAYHEAWPRQQTKQKQLGTDTRPDWIKVYTLINQGSNTVDARILRKLLMSTVQCANNTILCDSLSNRIILFNMPERKRRNRVLI